MYGGIQQIGTRLKASGTRRQASGLRPADGIIVNQRLKQLMKELGEAINESLSESEQIAEVISKIKAGGYDVFLVLEATIGFNKHEEPQAAGKPSLVPSRHADPDFKISAQDVKFLKSLRISIDDAA